MTFLRLVNNVKQDVTTQTKRAFVGVSDLAPGSIAPRHSWNRSRKIYKRNLNAMQVRERKEAIPSNEKSMTQANYRIIIPL